MFVCLFGAVECFESRWVSRNDSYKYNFHIMNIDDGFFIILYCIINIDVCALLYLCVVCVCIYSR